MTSKNFNIKETVDRNIQKHQFPSFANHRSLIGWCSMNYPKVLVNPVYLQKKVEQPQQKMYDLDYIFQKKNPIQRQQLDFVKPLTNYSQDKVSNLIPNAKISSFSLATTKHQTKAKIFTQNNQGSEEYSAIKPLMCVLGPNKDQDFRRKVRKIGQVYYNPPTQSQQMRHLKKLPNTIINEHNLVDIMDQNMLFLDLQYKTDISNDLINKIGYLAPNITELVLTSTLIDNNVLIQLGKSCKKLQAIDISLCNLIEEKAVLSFLKDSSKRLKKFRANHNVNSITDKCLELIGSCQVINDLSINFCENVTSDGFQFIADKQFEKLGFSTLPNVKGQNFAKVIMSSSAKLTQLDLSFNYADDINNAFFGKIGNCTKLVTLNLTQCNPDKITDEAMNNLAIGIKGSLKQPEGFANLTTLKLARMRQISDSLHHLVRKCPALTFLDANNLQKLTDRFLDQIKGHPCLKTVMLNFTQNITDEKIKEIKQGNKNLNLIRTIIKNTDPTDDGLRMPIPLASMKIKKPKKNKKK